MITSKEHSHLLSKIFLIKHTVILDVITRILAVTRLIVAALASFVILKDICFAFMHFSTLFVIASSYSINEGERFKSILYLLLFVISIIFGVCLLLYAVLPGKRRFLSIVFIADLIFDEICLVSSMIVGTYSASKLVGILITAITAGLVLIKMIADRNTSRHYTEVPDSNSATEG